MSNLKLQGVYSYSVYAVIKDGKPNGQHIEKLSGNNGWLLINNKGIALRQGDTPEEILEEMKKDIVNI